MCKMFMRSIEHHRKLDPSNYAKHSKTQKRNSNQSGLCECAVFFAWNKGMIYMFIIMSLMLVKFSTALQQNQTQPFLLQNYNYQQNEIESDTPQYGQHSAQAVAEAEAEEVESEQETTLEHSEDIGTTTTTAIGAASDKRSLETATTQLIKRKHIEEMRAKLQQLQEQQRQQYEQQQQQLQLQLQHQQQQQQQQHLLHAMPIVGSETAYLLERADNNVVGAHEQPIYGTWRTKARRPQPPLSPLSISAASVAGAGAGGAGMQQRVANTAITVGVGNQQNHQNHQQHDTDYQLQQQLQLQQQQQNQNHLYERLPRRAATMTPLHDQLPRPPRLLATQRPATAALVRRQYSETPGSLAQREEPKPKPFHFPYDGPMPEQFKKLVGERPQLHNIQDILQHLHLTTTAAAAAAPSSMPSKLPPQMLLMPTGLHIAGTFKNLKSSGIANFFRGKRHKKQMPMVTIPIPLNMQFLSGGGVGYPQPAPMQLQRIAMDQFYQYKPRSPHDVNLLAMQQQQLTGNLGQKKNKKQQQKFEQQLQQFAVDSYLPPQFGPFLALNATRQPKLKRVPFKVNLDIYPVLPPSKEYKPFMLDDAKLMQQATRPGSALRNPFVDYMQMPLIPSAAALTATSSYQQQQQPIYGPFKFPTQLPQTSNTHIVFPEQANRYNQQQQQQQQQPQQQQQYYQQQQQQQQPLYQQQQQQHKFPHSHPQTPFLPPDHVYPVPSANPTNTKTNQIMVHLNVFPKQKTTTTNSTFKPSTNPFYNNVIQRHTIAEAPELELPIEPRHPRAENGTNVHATQAPQNHTNLQQQQLQQHPKNQSISRSDRFDHDPLIDFEHPIVAADLPVMPHAAALVSNNRLDSLDSNASGALYDRIETRNNFHYNSNANIDQIASEAQTASLFRFPVEDLIQFQVDDAM